MGKSSQRKGRAAEIEVANILKAVGFDACVCGIYETLDVRCAIDGTDRLLEVKRKKETQGEAYKAIEAGAWGLVSRADRKEWLLTVPLKTFLDLRRRDDSAEITSLIVQLQSPAPLVREGE